MTNESGRLSDHSEAVGDQNGVQNTDHADRVVVSYPEDLSEWGQHQLEQSSFRSFLQKTRDEARVGDVWEEFVDIGCCGSTLDVPLRVERIDGGSRIDRETTIEYEPREAGEDGEVEGSWQAQGEAEPNRD